MEKIKNNLYVIDIICRKELAEKRIRRGEKKNEKPTKKIAFYKPLYLRNEDIVVNKKKKNKDVYNLYRKSGYQINNCPKQNNKKEKYSKRREKLKVQALNNVFFPSSSESNAGNDSDSEN